MMNTKHLSILLCLGIMLGILQPVLGQSTASVDSVEAYYVHDHYPRHSLFDKTKILLDEKGELTIDEVLAAKARGDFHPLPERMVEEKKEQAVWLQITLFPEVDIDNWWLVLKKEGQSMEYITAYDHVDVYFVQNGQLVRQSKTGLFVPTSQKDIATPVTVNQVWISLQAGSPTDIYIRIQDQAPIYPLVELRDPAFPLPSSVENAYKSVAILSHFTLIIGIYILFFFFYTRDYSYLYLCGMMACLFLHYQILHPHILLISWFFPEHPTLIKIAWPVLTTISYILFMQFGRTYSNLKTKFPFWDKLMRWSIGFLFIFMIVRLIPYWVNAPLVDFLNGPALGILMLIPLLVTFRLGFIKDTLIRYFVFAAVWLFFFSLLGILWQNGIIPFFDFPNPWIVAQTGFMFICALAVAYKIQISERAKAEVEKIKAIDSIKSKFFANISHEFRTPLSLILGPINQSLETIPASEVVEEDTEIPVKGKHLKVMKRNALRLNNLVDQILDLSKLDQGKMQLQVTEGDVIPFIRALVFSFESLAERKHIHFHTHFPQGISGAWFDRDKLEKILVNLLSNAFKFTPEHGEVSVRVEDTGKVLKLFISDTGSGMETAEVNKIFDRFYQVEGTHDQGTGIGLSLVKELVELHRGQIGVDSTEGKGTTFKVTLPYLKSDFLVDEWSKALPSEGVKIRNEETFDSEESVASTIDKETSDLPILLIVEDNPDLRHYIAEQLQQDFKIRMAKDGQEGLKMAEDHLPDLIISDVMMPKMNGLELCVALKSSIKTSHIPLILLTAKAGQDAKLEGLKTGADDYLTKPFDRHELLVRVNNLIAQRTKLREKFAGELKIRPSEVNLSSMDEEFIKLVMAKIEQNMGNEFYSVEDLASDVGFSRSQLHRKLKGITGKSPNHLIRDFRLMRAKELLEQKSATVSEIAFEVGYSNLSYFSKSYKEAFGLSPSET